MRRDVADGPKPVFPVRRGTTFLALRSLVWKSSVREFDDEAGAAEVDQGDETYSEDWRQSPMYVDHGDDDGRHFFGRWYDAEHIDVLVTAVRPDLEESGRRLARLSPMTVNRGYERLFPWLIPFAWLFPFVVHEVDGPGGDMMRLTFVKSLR